MKSLQCILSSRSLPSLISCLHFPFVLMSSNTCLNSLVLDNPLGFFHSSYNCGAPFSILVLFIVFIRPKHHHIFSNSHCSSSSFNHTTSKFRYQPSSQLSYLLPPPPPPPVPAGKCQDSILKMATTSSFLIHHLQYLSTVHTT